jgi:hypothetical protein
MMEIRINVVRARNLPNPRGNPYLKIKLSPDLNGLQKQKSLPQQRTQHPEFNEYFKLYWFVLQLMIFSQYFS